MQIASHMLEETAIITQMEKFPGNVATQILTKLCAGLGITPANLESPVLKYRSEDSLCVGFHGFPQPFQANNRDSTSNCAMTASVCTLSNSLSPNPNTRRYTVSAAEGTVK
jgi:hypothetical protein